MLYTYIIRYHHYSGNIRLRTSFDEFYKVAGNINSVLFPKQIASCLEMLGMETKRYINHHSVLPFYQLFVKQDLFSKICNEMMYDNSSYILRFTTNQNSKTKIRSDRLWYCPVCLKEHMRYEEIKIYQQIREVYVCAKHHCYLNSIELIPRNRLLNIKEWDFSVRWCDADSALVGIAEDASYIIDNPPGIDNASLRLKLLETAVQLQACVRNRWLSEDFIGWSNFYKSLPSEYEKYKTLASFRRFAARKAYRAIAPIEYLIFIRSLFGSFENFMKKF